MQHGGVDHVGGNQAAVEEDGKQDQEIEHLFARQIPQRQRIRHQRHNGHMADGTDQGDAHRGGIGPHNDRAGIPDILVSVQAQLLGEDGVTVDEQRVLVGDGRYKQQHERKNDDGHHQDHDNGRKQLKAFVLF